MARKESDIASKHSSSVDQHPCQQTAYTTDDVRQQCRKRIVGNSRQNIAGARAHYSFAVVLTRATGSSKSDRATFARHIAAAADCFSNIARATALYTASLHARSQGPSADQLLAVPKSTLVIDRECLDGVFAGPALRCGAECPAALLAAALQHLPAVGRLPARSETGNVLRVPALLVLSVAWLE